MGMSYYLKWGIRKLIYFSMCNSTHQWKRDTQRVSPKGCKWDAMTSYSGKKIIQVQDADDHRILKPLCVFLLLLAKRSS